MIPLVLRRAAHALIYRETYRVDPVTGWLYEDCTRRVTGRPMGTKESPPGDRPSFQPVARAS